MLYKNLLLSFSREPFLDFDSRTLLFFSIGLGFGTSWMIFEVGKWRKILLLFLKVISCTKQARFSSFVWCFGQETLQEIFCPSSYRKRHCFCTSVNQTPLMSHYVSDSRNKVTIRLSAANTLFLFRIMQFIFNMFIFFDMMTLFWEFFYPWNSLILAASWVSPTLISLFQLLVQGMSDKLIWLRNLSHQRWNEHYVPQAKYVSHGKVLFLVRF